MHRKCQKCRLERCFAMKMRTDYFLNKEKKQRQQKYDLPPMTTETLSQTTDEIKYCLLKFVTGSDDHGQSDGKHTVYNSHC